MSVELVQFMSQLLNIVMFIQVFTHVKFYTFTHVKAIRATPKNVWTQAEVYAPSSKIGQQGFFNKVFIVIQREMTCFHAHFFIEKYCTKDLS